MAKLPHTLISYQSRGPWGKPDFRGNTSGYLIRDLIDTYEVRSVLDPMSGGGTTMDVCREFKIPVRGYDIHDGYDLLDRYSQTKIMEDVMSMTSGRGVDMVFFHPPYYNMIKYTDRPGDFGNGSYESWIERMTKAMKFLETCLDRNGFIALLLADLRRKGQTRTYFLTDDACSRDVMWKANLEPEIRYTIVRTDPNIKPLYNAKYRHGEVGLRSRMIHENLTILRPRGYTGIIQTEVDEPEELEAIGG